MQDYIGKEEQLNLLQIVLLRKKLLLLITSISIVCALILSFVLTKYYKVEIEVMPVESAELKGGLSSIVGQFSGLSGLGGNSLSSWQKKEALAMLTSRQFIMEYLKENDLLKELFYKLWDAEKNSWKQSVSKVPSLYKGYKYFTKSILNVSEDKKAGVIKLTIEWKDPVLAAKWANDLVDKLNTKMRDNAVFEAEKSIVYLNDELKKASVLELKNSIYRLIEVEIQKTMLANVRREYAFKIIDPATVPDLWDYTRPRKLKYLFSGLMLGLFFSTLLALLLHFRQKR